LWLEIREVRVDLIRYLSLNMKGIFNIIIFSKTTDENFFRVASKYDAVKTVEVETGQRVREENEENYLKKGIYEPVTNPNLFSDKGSYWHNAYVPLSLKEGTFVARFMISSSDAVFSLEDYFVKSRRLPRRALSG